MISLFITTNLCSVLTAFFIDLSFGDPDFKLHPVRLIGRLITYLENRLYSCENKLMAGMQLLYLTKLIIAVTAAALLYIGYVIHPFVYFVINTLIIYFCISVRSMTDHAMRVYRPLCEGDIEQAKNELSMIVSRDTADMDTEPIVRSAVESVSENFTDGVVSPIFYSVLFGGMGAAVFKAVNTLDSMVGYRNEKYTDFGKASAITDDVLNFIPARLSVGIIMLGGLSKGISMGQIYEAVSEFRLSHPSPNSAHSMSAFAGALDITLGGPVSYFGRVKEKPYIGSGQREITPEVIIEAVSLFKRSAYAAVLIFSVLPLFRMFT